MSLPIRLPARTPRPSCPRALLVLLCLGVLALSPGGCRSTHFPDNPKEHPLAKRLREADPYYLLLANGVFSRVVAVQPPATASESVRAIKEKHWARLESLAEPGSITAFLRAEGLAEVADGIQIALAALAGQKPSTASAALEADAVKQGLIEAYYGLFPATPAP